MKSKSKSKAKTVLVVFLCVLTFLVVQTIPVYFPKPLGSVKIAGKNLNVYYQPSEEKGAREVFEILSSKADTIRTKMNFESDIPTNVYLYGSQNQLAIREAGLITLVIAPSWYIGDSHNGNIMMVSPYTSVKGHTHDSILNATLHELVHSINYQINPELSYFWDNGLATYLSDQTPSYEDLNSHSLPSLKDMQTENGLKFGEMGGYAFSYNYIDYLDKTYGWHKIVEYASGKKNYQEVFGKSEEDLYKDWVQHFTDRSL